MYGVLLDMSHTRKILPPGHGEVVKIGDDCYAVTGATLNPPNSFPDSLDFDSCEECEKCAGSSDCAYHSSVHYASFFVPDGDSVPRKIQDILHWASYVRHDYLFPGKAYAGVCSGNDVAVLCGHACELVAVDTHEGNEPFVPPTVDTCPACYVVDMGELADISLYLDSSDGACRWVSQDGLSVLYTHSSTWFLSVNSGPGYPSVPTSIVFDLPYPPEGTRFYNPGTMEVLPMTISECHAYCQACPTCYNISVAEAVVATIYLDETDIIDGSRVWVSPNNRSVLSRVSGTWFISVEGGPVYPSTTTDDQDMSYPAYGTQFYDPRSMEPLDIFLEECVVFCPSCVTVSGAGASFTNGDYLLVEEGPSETCDLKQQDDLASRIHISGVYWQIYDFSDNLAYESFDSGATWSSTSPSYDPAPTTQACEIPSDTASSYALEDSSQGSDSPQDCNMCYYCVGQSSSGSSGSSGSSEHSSLDSSTISEISSGSAGSGSEGSGSTTGSIRYTPCFDGSGSTG